MQAIKKVGYISLATSLVRVCSGPITLAAISLLFSSESLGFYYTFFSFVAIKQLLELGFGNVIKQFIAYENIKNYDTKIQSLYILNVIWFFTISLILIVIVYPVGLLYFSSSPSNVEWQTPWLMTIVSVCFATINLPFQIYMDATQKQVELRKILLVGVVIYSLSLWTLLYLSFDLYSFALAILFRETYILFKTKKYIYWDWIKPSSFIFDSVKISFFNILPLLKRSAVVFGAGYFFWNAHMLIGFQVLGASQIGKVGFITAMASVGVDISTSIVKGQSTIFSNLIASNRKKQAHEGFSRTFLYSSLMILTGYSLFVLSYDLMLDYEFLAEKMISKEFNIFVFIAYFLIFVMVSINTFMRCYKIEPFVSLAIINGIFFPVIFYMSFSYTLTYTYLAISILLLLSVFIYIKSYLELKNEI